MPLDTSFLPTLSPYDVQRAAELIQKAYAPQTAGTSPDELKMLQHELFELQKRPEAWGLVLPLLEHQDPNVQFFGAHTAQVKIARDWSLFPQEHAIALRDLLVQLTGHCMTVGLGKFILRKLCVALTSLALRLVPGQPTQWPDWIMACVVSFTGRNAPTEQIHEFLVIVAEEIDSADFIGSSRVQVKQSLADATPMVSQAIRQALESGQHIPSALRCLAAWISMLTGDHITPLIPLLISLLTPTSHERAELFIAASDALQELLSKSSLAAGAGTRVLTEPLLLWLSSTGAPIVEAALAVSGGNGNDDGVIDEELSRSLCKLIVALGDHSTNYFANNITSNTPINRPSQGPGSGYNTPTNVQTRGQLTQNFLRIVLAYTSLPGYYGVDEEESELTLGFWYLFQESLWATNFGDGDEDDEETESEWISGEGGGSWKKVKEKDTGDAQLAMSKAVYIELVKALRRKVAFPGKGSGWSKDQIEKFQVYRRDVGDTLINAYYVLRDDMLQYYLDDVSQRLASNPENTNGAWQEIEATLHCITSIQEALDFEKTPHLSRVFSAEIIGRLPSTGSTRLRRTTISLIGAYSSWFATCTGAQNTPELLMNALNYVVTALPEPALCLQAANALRKLCDANRKALAPQIGAFAQLHAALGNIPDSEKAKVVQSIASVIQALPPADEIEPILAIVRPIILRLGEILQSTNLPPDDVRTAIVHQLETLSGVAKGLTRSTEGILIFADEEEEHESSAKTKEMTQARADPRMESLRQELLNLIRAVVQVWSSDATVGQSISELFKSITSLPNDNTLLTLPPGPLFELVCIAAQRQLTAVWLSLAAILIAQLNPPPPVLTPSLGKSTAPAEAEAIVNGALPILLQCSLTTLGQPGAMEANPDIVQEFFGCMDRVAQDFTRAFYVLPQDAQDALINCGISALALQERYSLVSACGFLSTLIQRSSLYEELAAEKDRVMHVHGRNVLKAILEGFAGVAPRSVVPNLIELMGTVLGRSSRSSREAGGGPGGLMAVDWMKEILSSDSFIPSKATPEVKQQFIRAVSNNPKSLKKTREAANQFTLIARGLEGSGFGYASVSM